MDKLSEQVSGFLEGLAPPYEKQIQEFAVKIALENPTLDLENFKKNLLKLARQSGEIKACEKELSLLGKDSRSFNELEKTLKAAKKGQKNLEDVTSELKAAKNIIMSIKGGSDNRPGKSEASAIKQELVSGAKSRIEAMKEPKIGNVNTLRLEDTIQKTEKIDEKPETESQGKPLKKSDKKGKKDIKAEAKTEIEGTTVKKGKKAKKE